MKVAERKQENEENDQIFHKIIQMNFKKDGKMALMDTWGGNDYFTIPGFNSSNSKFHSKLVSSFVRKKDKTKEVQRKFSTACFRRLRY